MEVTVSYEREKQEEEEEVIGVDLQTRRRRSQSQNSRKSNSFSNSSGSSIISSDSSDSSFEYFRSMENTDNNNNKNDSNFTNGEKPNIIEGRSIIEEVEEDENLKSENHINVLAQNHDNNGFTVQQNGSGVVEYPPPENNKEKEMDIGPNITNFSKSPGSDVGLKDVENMLDESSNGANVTPPETYNAELNIVNKTLVLSGQNEIVESNHSEELDPEVEEFDIERVIQKQETHDLICPNCNACITKRVILKRRKRKLQEISEGAEAFGLKVGQTASIPSKDPDTDETKPEKEPSLGEKAPDARLDGISCFSCFSIFVPKGDGFLCWRFKPKPPVAAQPGDPPASSLDLAEMSVDDGTGTGFPLWILTCCQPYHTEKPVSKPESKPSLTPENGKRVSHHKSELPSPPSDDTSVPSIVPDPELPLSEKPVEETHLQPMAEPSVAPTKDKDFPLWILTCCQPSIDKIKPEDAPRPGVEVSIHGRDPISLPKEDTAVHPTGTLTHKPDAPVSEPLNSNEPLDGPMLPTEREPLVTPEEGKLPLWILTCCQPASEGKEQKRPEKPITASQDTPVPPTQPPTTTNHAETTTLFKPLTPIEPVSGGTKTFPVTPEGGPPLQPAPLRPVKINEVKPSPPNPEPPGTPPKDEVTVPIFEEPHIPQHPAPPLDATGTGNLLSFVQSSLQLPHEPPRPGISGMDIIKAIVYGGLLECITSLSVISSAAGGDATTLNIVALGLANVCGGFVLLLHNLRVLKHEHTTERYEDQLGTPGHFLLHAVVAVISYLVFGLMSPVIYGFSFHKSDNKDYKLATLAAASLVCITILSIGKAYVRRPPKSYIKTIFYYISIGFMVSGVGYVAGDLINMLLKKLGVFDSSAPVAMSLLEAGATTTAWSSY